MDAADLHQMSSQGTCKRPAVLQALGKAEPPLVILVDGDRFERTSILKHDSWAATAVYACGLRLVACKLNRVQPIFLLPMAWLGRWLASRELWFLRTLQGIRGIPAGYAVDSVEGNPLPHAVAHDFIAGQPLSLVTVLPNGFFDRLRELLQQLHARRVAYIDLHKQENVIVGDDGLPHLIDFQISVHLPKYWGLRSLFQSLAVSDLYHLDKHRRRWNVRDWHAVPVNSPWWIRLHRWLTVPLRMLRRRLLVLLRVRRGTGRAASELAPEAGLKR